MNLKQNFKTMKNIFATILFVLVCVFAIGQTSATFEGSPPETATEIVSSFDAPVQITWLESFAQNQIPGQITVRNASEVWLVTIPLNRDILPGTSGTISPIAIQSFNNGLSWLFVLDPDAAHTLQITLISAAEVSKDIEFVFAVSDDLPKQPPLSNVFEVKGTFALH